MNTLPPDARDKSIKDAEPAALLRMWYEAHRYTGDDTHAYCRRRAESLQEAVQNLDSLLIETLATNRELEAQVRELLDTLNWHERMARRVLRWLRTGKGWTP